MSAELAILITLILYEVVLVGFGFIAKDRTQDGADFFLGGRGLGPWVAAISASASSSSAWTLLGVSGAAYAWGLSAIWLFPACVGGFILNWYVLAPKMRRLSHDTGALTTTDILAAQAGGLRRPITVVASLIILVSMVTYVSSQFQGAGKTFAETFDLSMHTSIIIGSIIVIFYTLLGGFWAVSLTDTLQGLMMALTSIILPVAALVAVGGLSAMIEGMSAVPVEGFDSWASTRGLGGGALFVIATLGIGLGYPGQPHVVNRFMALADGADTLQKARRIAVAWAVIVYAGMLVLGWCGRLLIPALADKEVVFIAATSQLFPPVIAGIMLAAVLSAIMSTADSQLLVAASAATHDLGYGGDNLVKRTRWVIAGLSIFAVIAAIGGPQEIFSYVLFAWTAMGCAFGPLLLVTALRGPVPPMQSLMAMSAGFVLSVTAYWYPVSKGTVVERVLPFVVAGAIAAVRRRR